VLQIVDVAEPSIKKGQVLIRNFASSVNPIDWKIRSGMLRPLSGMFPPFRCGCDFAGEIIDMASDVTGFAMGDRVFGFLSPLKPGAYAELVAVDAALLAHIPNNLSYTEAAVVPLAGLTAYDALTRVVPLAAGQRIIINGCSGGVGTMAIQIAKIIGADVVGVCSHKNHALALELGADEAIDYHENPKFRGVGSADVFFDVVGSRSLSTVQSVLKTNGVYVHTLPELKTFLIDPLLNVSSKQKSRVVMVKSSGVSLQVLSEWMSNHLLKPVIERGYSLEEISAAQVHSETGRTKGKVSVVIR